jgi:hypothetical protein
MKKALDVPASFAKVADAFAGQAGVTLEKGWGAGNVVLKVKKKIFAMTIKGDLVAKLPRERVDALVVGGIGDRFDPRRNGKVMKEWLVVPEGKASWIALAREAHHFVSGGGEPAPAQSFKPRRAVRAKRTSRP